MPAHLMGLLGLLASSQALAQEPPSPPADAQEIVVEGQRDREQQVREFVRTITVPERNFGQLGRFELTACPLVVGLGPSQDRKVEQRMKQVALAGGIESGGQRCIPNVFVFIADDKERTIKWMGRHTPYLFVHANGRAVVISHDKSPATAWHLLGTKDRAGRESDFYVYGETPSLIRPMARPHFLASVLVVEARALAGLTTTEFADYAAMRSFAQLDPLKMKDRSVPTILTILDAPTDTAVPLTLTGWDLAFLRGLYGSEYNQYAGTQQREIGRSMLKDLTRPQRN